MPDSFPNELNFPGKRLEINVPIGNKNWVLTISKDSLIADGKNKYVYVFSEGVAKKSFISTGKSFKNDIEVLSGLRKGDLVVVKGNENLRPNQIIKIKSKKKFFKTRNKN